MRTTVNLDEDIFVLTRQIAQREGKPAGVVLSDLARRGLYTPEVTTSGHEALPSCSDGLAELGLIPYQAQAGKLVTNAIINTLRETEGI